MANFENVPYKTSHDIYDAEIDSPQPLNRKLFATIKDKQEDDLLKDINEAEVMEELEKSEVRETTDKDEEPLITQEPLPEKPVIIQSNEMLKFRKAHEDVKYNILKYIFDNNMIDKSKRNRLHVGRIIFNEIKSKTYGLELFKRYSGSKHYSQCKLFFSKLGSEESKQDPSFNFDKVLTWIGQDCEYKNILNEPFISYIFYHAPYEYNEVGLMSNKPHLYSRILQRQLNKRNGFEHFQHIFQFVKQKLTPYQIVLHERRAANNDLAIYNPHLLYFFSDSVNWCTEVMQTEVILRKLKNSVAYIDNGGAPLIVTKMLDSCNDNAVIWKTMPYRFWARNIKVLQMCKKMCKKTKTEILVPILIDLKSIIAPHIFELQFDTCGFIPFGSNAQRKLINPRIFNFFVGFQGQTYSKTVSAERKDLILKTHLEHAKLICGGNNMEDGVFDYLQGWIAHLIQNPGDKARGGVCPVFRSGQGTGKSIFWENIGKYVIGSRYYYNCNDMAQILHNFNAILENVVFTILDEVQNFGGQRNSNDKLKSFITQLNITIEKKGIDAMKSNNYTRFVMLTNNEWTVKVEPTDRRYFCVEPSHERIGDRDYFNNFSTVCDNYEAGKVIFDYYKSYNKPWDATKIPMTKFRAELMSKSNPETELTDFLSYVLENCDDIYAKSGYKFGRPFVIKPNEILLHQALAYDLYGEWFNLNKTHISKYYNIQKFKKVLQEFAQKHKFQVQNHNWNKRVLGIKSNLKTYFFQKDRLAKILNCDYIKSSSSCTLDPVCLIEEDEDCTDTKNSTKEVSLIPIQESERPIKKVKFI